MQLNIFLLNAEIWGNVSDWCMVLITAITAYYLYRTLQSQKDVQETQTKLFEIENVRFREGIKPLLHYAVSEIGIKFDSIDKNKRVLSIEVTNETDSLALEIISEHSDKQIFIPIDFDTTRRHARKGDKPLFFHFMLDSKIDSVIFSLTYQDIAGTKYKQGVYCLSDSAGTEVHPFLPETVN